MAMKEKQPDPIKTFRAQWAVMTFYERFEQVIALALSAIIAVIIVVSLLQLISIVFSLLVIDAFNPLDHKVFQIVFGMIMTLLIAMEFKHSIVRVALRRDSIIQVKTVILIALLAQLGLSRVREFDADRLAAELTGDPQGLALALAKIERESRAWLLPGWGKPEPS
nr:phosphate-starvation-inducible PsiE family protein [Acinetobacter baumannii]